MSTSLDPAIENTATVIFCGLCTLMVIVEPINNGIRAALSIGDPIQDLAEDITEGLSGTPDKGEKIGNYLVTSPYLPCEKSDGSDCRIHPITGQNGAHHGTDLGTPTGSQLFAPGKSGSPVIVECSESEKGGLTATIVPSDPKGLKFRVLHLSKCDDGETVAGRIFGLSGESGTSSTGPHAHIEQYERGELVPPSRKWLWMLVDGRER